MPRQSDGTFTLVPGNPVLPDTTIESVWANATMTDLANGLTGSVARNGSTPMTGPLTLVPTAPTEPHQAASKAYVDGFVAVATGLPIGAIISYPATVAIPGFFLCDGQEISRATYSSLFALIGTTFGAGDGASTFNLPNLQDWFVRGLNPATRAMGSQQVASIAPHTHPLTDPGHTHVIADPQHTHVQNAHNHGITDPGHAHSAQGQVGGNLYGQDIGYTIGVVSTSTNPTGITVNNAVATEQAAATGISLANATTGITSGLNTGSETVPKNVALNYYIKAVNDGASPGTGVQTIQSTDPEVITVDASLPTAPTLIIHSNVALGLVKLDVTTKIPVNLLPTSSQSYLGPFNASSGNNPSQAFPTQTFFSGDTYAISVAGNILVVDPITFVPAVALVTVGSNIVYVSNGVNPIGWYTSVAASNVAANQVSNIPAGTITATNVQDALNELDTLKIPLTSIDVDVMGYIVPGTSGNVMTSNGAIWVSQAPGAGAGDVSGPGIAIDNAIVLFNGTTGKIIKDSAVLLPASALVGINDAQTLTGKTIAFGSNTVSGTIAQFNTACSDADFATLTGSEVLTNKTINAANNTLTGTAAALSIGGNAATATMASSVPRSTTVGTAAVGDTGRCVAINANISIPASVFAAGNAVSVYNDTAGPLTIIQGAGLTMHLAGSATVGNRTIAQRGMATIWFNSTTDCAISGPGVT